MPEMYVRYSKKRGKGFLILEVLIALCLCSIAFLCVSNFYVQIRKVNHATAQKFRALQVLCHHIEKLNKAQNPALGTTVSDDFSLAWEIARVAVVREVPVDLVHISVQWQEQDHWHKIELDTVLLDSA